MRTAAANESAHGFCNRKSLVNNLIAKCLVLFLPLLNVNILLMAQSDNREFTSEVPQYTIRFDGGISNPIRSIAFRNNFYAVGDAKLGFHLRLFNGLNAGISIRYTGVQVDPRRTNKVDTVFDQNLQIFRPFLTYQIAYTPAFNIGYDYSMSKSVFFNVNAAAGMSLVRYYRLRSGFENIPKSSYNFNTPSVEGSVNLYYFFEDKVGVSFKLGYTMLFREFDPVSIGFGDGEISYTTPELKGNMQFFTFGLGFIYSFRRVE